MKLGIVYQGTYPPSVGASGADRRVRDLARGIAAAGCDVTMYVPTTRRPRADTAGGDHNVEYLGEVNETITGRLSYWRALVNEVRQCKVDFILLYNTSAESILYVNRLKSSGAKVLYEICDLHSSFTLSLRNLIVGLAERILPRQADGIIVISQFLETFVSQQAPSTPRITVPILVDGDLFAKGYSENRANLTDSPTLLGIHENDILITYVGGHWKHEGIRYLLEAFSKISDERPHLKLLVAGKLERTEAHDDVASLAATLVAQKRVILTGWVDTNEVVKIFERSDVLCVPQTNHTFSQAGLPTKLAEYASMGKAILATRVGDVPRYFIHEQNALLCTAEDSNAMAEQLRRLVNDAKLRRVLGEAAAETAREIFDYRMQGRRVYSWMNDLAHDS